MGNGSIKPFNTPHTWADPDEALDFYEESVGTEFPESIVNLLYQVAELYPEVLFNVQPAYSTNYLAAARAGDRRSWLFIRPERVSIWVAHSRTAAALINIFEDLKEPESQTRGTRQYVDLEPEGADSEGALAAVEFAAQFARPFEEDDDRNREKFG